MIKLSKILLENDMIMGSAPKKIPSEICWHLSEKKRSTFPDFGFHIGTELQALDRGKFMLYHEMADDMENLVFYLHKVKINPSAEIYPDILFDDPEEGYTIPSDQIDKNKIYFYENGHEGLNGPKPNLSIYTSGNNIKLVQIIKLDTKGYEDGESEFDKKFNSTPNTIDPHTL
tara:strand:- start:242 stop:760 length:519 start_codon:yes stop_codon:yes gene_type:complete